MDNNSSISKSSYCTPAQVYLVFAVILFVISSIKVKPTLVSVIIHSLYIIFWTVLLNYICSKGYTGVSWFLLFLPFIFIVVTILISIGMSINK